MGVRLQEVKENTIKKKLLHSLQNDSTSVRRSLERVGLQPSTKMGLLVLLISPSIVTTADAELAGCANSSGFTHGDKREREGEKEEGERDQNAGRRWTRKPGPSKKNPLPCFLFFLVVGLLQVCLLLNDNIFPSVSPFFFHMMICDNGNLS